MSILDWIKGSDKPTSSGTTDALHDELHKTIVAYGVSNRKLTSDGKSFDDSRLSAPIDTAPHYFKQDVEVKGTKGNFHTVKAGDPQIITKPQFDQGVASEVKAAGGKLGIYTHGIRTAAGESAPTAAELAADTGEPFVIEDWAATKSSIFLAAHQEKLDDRASFLSQDMIDTSVKELAQKFGAKNIDMVAHSRGSMNQIRALADLQNSKAGTVNSATFAHSDVDISDFELSLPSFQGAAKHVNVLYNNSDKALKLSEVRRFGQIAIVGDSSQGGFEQSARLGRLGLSPGDSTNSYVASKIPNYFSIAKESALDCLGHAFAPSTVASMIHNSGQYESFSTLKFPGELKPVVSAFDGVGRVMSAVPTFALRVLSAERAKIDTVTNSPEVQKYFMNTKDDQLALLLNRGEATL